MIFASEAFVVSPLLFAVRANSQDDPIKEIQSMLRFRHWN